MSPSPAEASVAGDKGEATTDGRTDLHSSHGKPAGPSLARNRRNDREARQLFLSLMNPDTREDPFDTLAHIRELGESFRLTPNVWVLSRYADVRTALFDSDLMPQTPEGTKPPADVDHRRERFESQMLPFRTGQPHASRRKAVREAFRPEPLEMLSGAIDELLKGLQAPDREFEVMSSVITPIVDLISSRLLGAAAEQASHLRTLMVREVSELTGDLRPRSQSAPTQVATPADSGWWAAVDMATRFLRNAAFSTPSAPTVATTLAGSIELGEIDGETDAVAQMLTVTGGIVESLHSALGSIARRVLERPGQLDPSDQLGLSAFCEESFRMDVPNLYQVRRTMTRPTKLPVSAKPGDLIILLTAAANRDPRRYDRPETFDPERYLIGPPDHLSFGIGPHFCLGRQVAKISAEKVATWCATRLEDREVAAVAYAARPRIRGITELIVAASKPH